MDSHTITLMLLTKIMALIDLLLTSRNSTVFISSSRHLTRIDYIRSLLILLKKTWILITSPGTTILHLSRTREISNSRVSQTFQSLNTLWMFRPLMNSNRTTICSSRAQLHPDVKSKQVMVKASWKSSPSKRSTHSNRELRRSQVEIWGTLATLAHSISDAAMWGVQSGPIITEAR